jgi:hypothetical protein
MGFKNLPAAAREQCVVNVTAAVDDILKRGVSQRHFQPGAVGDIG